jgi:CRISPR-associated endonuclease Csy4
MTTHYIDITLLPDPEFSHAHLLGALMAKLHRALVQLKSTDIGVSFPQHVNAPLTKRTLGAVLRLHGAPTALDGLMALAWLKGMRDHVQVSALAQVPTDAKHRLVQRRQFKTNAERLRRRRMARKGETAEQAAASPTCPSRNCAAAAQASRFACLWTMERCRLRRLRVLSTPMA